MMRSEFRGMEAGDGETVTRKDGREARVGDDRGQMMDRQTGRQQQSVDTSSCGRTASTQTHTGSHLPMQYLTLH